MSKTSKQKAEVMREVMVECLGEELLLDSPELRTKCYHAFMKRTNFSIYTARNHYNMVFNDLRELVPVGKEAIKTLKRSWDATENIDKIIADLEADIQQFKTGFDPDDRSNFLSEDESYFSAKTELRSQLLKAYDIKSGLMKNVGDLATKIMKNNVDLDRNDIAQEKNKIISNIVPLTDINRQLEKYNKLQDAIVNKKTECLEASYTVLDTTIKEKEPIEIKANDNSDDGV